MTRRELREHIFKLLYLAEFHEAEEIPEQIGLYFDKLGEAKDQDLTYIRTKYEKILEKRPEIDECWRAHPRAGRFPEWAVWT